MEETKPQTFRMVPPREMFVADDLPVMPHHDIPAGQLVTPTTEVVLPEQGGILSYHVGDKFPVKSWPFKEAIFAVDIIKRLIINSVKFCVSSPARYLLIPLIFLPASVKRKLINNLIEGFADFTVIVFDRWGRIMEFDTPDGNSFGLQGVVWKPSFYCDMVREFRRVALEMAGDNKSYKQLVEAICMILEHDDAYRYRIQDGFGSINHEELKKNPSKEIVRVLKIMRDRGTGTAFKFDYFIKFVPFLFYIKDFRNVFNEFFSKVNIKKLCLDEIDMYRCLLWGGHKFGGMTDEERVSLRMMIDTEYKGQLDLQKQGQNNK